MAISTKIRQFARLLDQSCAVVWVINQSDELTYLSAGCADWLGVDGDQLVGRRSKAGTAVSDDPMDLIAASLSPPPGLSTRGTASLRIQPPQSGNHRGEMREVRYLRVGPPDLGFTIGVAGDFDDRRTDPDVQNAVAIRQRIDQWRLQQSGLGSVLLLGESRFAKRMRQRTELASSVRTHVCLFQSRGGGADRLATYIHQRSSQDEPLIRIDGPLMDAELLDSALMPVLSRLSDSKTAKASILWNQLNQTSIPTQQRLSGLIDSYQGRLRLFGVCETSQLSNRNRLYATDNLVGESEIQGEIYSGLSDLLENLKINCANLAQRVEDLQAMSFALLGQQKVIGKVIAERVSRPALDAIVRYTWPHNFSELEDAIRYASQNAISEAIRVEDLPLNVRSYRPNSPSTEKVIQPLDEQIAEYESRLIAEAMEAAKQNRAEAARSLGISRSRLLRKLENTRTVRSSTENES